MAEGRGQIIGIDLGTTFSSTAYLDPRGTPVTIPNSEGDLITPSVILFEESGTVIVGRQAQRAALLFPERIASCVKRDMGEPFYSQLIAGKRLSPVTLSALILKKLKQDAEKRIGPTSGAVITVPAYFDEARRQATIDAGTIAGLNVIDIINEPTSAALAFALDRFLKKGGKPGDLTALTDKSDKPITAVVYDLGGGTFDVTVIRMVGNEVKVLATDGDVRLGGKDWDERIIDYCAKLFIKEFGQDPREDRHSHQDLLLSSEEAKKDLSRRVNTAIAVNHAGNRLMVPLSRERFEEMTGDLLYRTESRLNRVIKSAALTWDDVDEVLMVGGGTRMPQVGKMLARVTGREPNAVLAVDEVVACGAAIHAAILQVTGRIDEDMVGPITVHEGAAEYAPESPVAQAKELDFGPVDAASQVGVEGPAAEAPPADVSQEVELEPAAEGLFSMKEAEEKQALAAFDHDVSDILSEVTTVNVNAHSLGVVASSPRTRKEYVSILIRRNSPLPASGKKVYGTETDNQRIVRVRVVEGESRDPGACMPIGECVVAPLPQGLPKGSPIRVLFRYDQSGRLHVEAQDEASGAKAQTVFIRSMAMTGEQLDKARTVVSQTTVV
jgi:molecular chaperone DnaK (HSP70)